MSKDKRLEAFDNDIMDWMSHGVRPDISVIRDKHGVSDREYADHVVEQSAAARDKLLKMIRDTFTPMDTDPYYDALVSEYIANYVAMSFLTKDLRRSKYVNFGRVKKMAKNVLKDVENEYKSAFSK